MTAIIHGRFTQRHDLVSGIWKFRGSVSHETLLVLAEAWLDKEPELYLDMQVRGCGKDGAMGIQVTRRFAPGEDYDAYFYRVSDQLKRRFGNELIGWDVTNSVWTLRR